MNRIVVDPSLQSRLWNLDTRLELCDEAGTVLGYYIPASERRRLIYDWARDQFSEEELARSRAEPGGFSLAEILAELPPA